MDIMDIMDIIDITDITDTMVIMDIIDTVSTCLPDRTNLKASRTLIRISSIIFSRSASGRYSMNTVMGLVPRAGEIFRPCTHGQRKILALSVYKGCEIMSKNDINATQIGELPRCTNRYQLI